MGVATVVVLAGVVFHSYYAHASAQEVQHATELATEATKALSQERENFATQLRELRQESDAKADSLQRQIDLVQQSQVAKK